MTATAFGMPLAIRVVPSIGSTATSHNGPVPSPTSSPLYSMGALSFSPSPMTTTPRIDTVPMSCRIALTAAPSPPFLSPRPTQRPAAIAAASVTRTSSSARLRSGASCRTASSLGTSGMVTSAAGEGCRYPPYSHDQVRRGGGCAGLGPVGHDGGVTTASTANRGAVRTARNMVGALLILLVPVIGWAALSQPTGHGKVHVVDTKPDIRQAKAEARFPVLVPAGLPARWRPTSSRVE